MHRCLQVSAITLNQRARAATIVILSEAKNPRTLPVTRIYFGEGIPMRSRPHLKCSILLLVTFAVCLTLPGFTQSAAPAPTYPAHLPYALSNFVWWTDADLRQQLKERIPGLGEEIAPDRASESKIRDTLKALLKQKGIVADVMSEEPSPWSLTAETVPGAPGPAIVFSILNPQILVDQITIAGAPKTESDAIDQSLHGRKDREYSRGNDWYIREQAENQLQLSGYFDAQVNVDHDAPRLDGDQYRVNLTVSIIPGEQYHIGEITGDGGPLLKGRDLSTLFKIKPGDIATSSPFGKLAGQLLGLYEHYGYADAVVEGPPIVDHEHALVSYHLTVTPGPLYHLRSLTIHNLDAGQESKVRRLLGIGPGDLFDELVVSSLYNKVRADSSLNAYTFSFSPVKDKSAEMVDLTLDFSRNANQPTVTVP
jgi:outer membrane protein insertion porin family